MGWVGPAEDLSLPACLRLRDLYLWILGLGNEGRKTNLSNTQDSLHPLPLIYPANAHHTLADGSGESAAIQGLALGRAGLIEVITLSLNSTIWCVLPRSACGAGGFGLWVVSMGVGLGSHTQRGGLRVSSVCTAAMEP